MFNLFLILHVLFSSQMRFQMILNHLVAGGVGGVVVLTVLLASPFAMLVVSHGQDFNKHNAVLSSKIDLSLMLIAYASKVDPL